MDLPSVGRQLAVSPSDVSVLNDFGDNRITLTTCNPEFSSSQRLIVVGKLARRQRPQRHAPSTSHVTYHVEDTGTASWNWSLLPLVGIESVCWWLLGLSYRRFRGWFGRPACGSSSSPCGRPALYLLFTTLTPSYLRRSEELRLAVDPGLAGRRRGHAHLATRCRPGPVL